MKLLPKTKPKNHWLTTNAWKVMKLTSILVIALTFQVSAAVSSQTITFSGKNVPFKKVISVMKSQTNYVFFYDMAILKNVKPISINVVSAPIEKVLEQAFAETSITWIIEGKTISLIPKVEKAKESTNLSIQQNIIKGKITDEKGAPLPGVTILVKNTKKATTTDFDGNFELKTADSESTLVISYIGFATQEVKVSKSENLKIVLLQETSKLEDVVVVGYGSKKRKDLTGAVTTLSSDSYKDQPVLNSAAAIQGRVAGVAVNNNSGAPGGGIKVRIRGANSVNAGNEPLYVVDGIALSSSGFQDVNINDISSMEILKDASGTAIYGSRGANGVILITTKSGKTGKTKIQYSSFVSFNSPMKKYDLMDAVTYAKVANVAAGTTVFPNPDSFANKTTDMQNKIFANAVTQNHQVTVSGGTDNTKYFISGFYTDQEGLLLNSNQNKFGLRSNLGIKLSERFNLDLGMFVSRINSKNNTDIGDKGNPVMSGMTWAPTEPIYDDDANGLYNVRAVSPIWQNPYMILKERNSNDFSNVGIFNGKLKYKITDWLTFTVNTGLDMKISKGAFLNNQWISPGNMGSGQSYREAYTFQNSDILTFHKTFNTVHDLTVTAVYENTSNKTSGFGASGSGLSSTINGYDNLSLNASQGISSNYTNWGILSYMGRLEYAYDSKYLLTATMRRDGSSKFQGKNKWSNFPSVGLGWKLSEESFIKDMDVFSTLKLRAGWGITGNQSVPPYSTLGLLNPFTYSYGTPTGYLGYSIGNPATPDVKWETTSQVDVGIDVSLLNNRLNFTADYYNKDTRDLLLFTNIPNYSGGGTFLKNVGKVNNRGFEMAVDFDAIQSENFKWSLGGNFSTNQNKVMSLGDESIVLRGPINGLISSPIQAIKKGEPLGSFYLIPWTGIYKNDDPTLGFKAGDNRYTDVSGNNSIGDEDKVISGSATPKYQWGFTNNFSYKNFELNIFIQGAHGNKMFNATYAATAVPTSDVAYPTLNEVSNYWTPQNTNAVWANPGSTTNRNIIESTRFLQDASYVRVKNISLSYSIPKSVVNVSSAKISISAQNFLTFTKYKGFDPEASSTSSSSDADAGIDLGAYPSPKTVTLSLNIGL
ncbi:SusC/RagA family TonB-linked outer membrane protein [Flavobacterium sufflavum]|uniref:SusC/RagA family TonB-linked outer membrane protein n=1 Tax=Flavobacterium sufflavum TaxID=1921138 RepID=A0A437KLM5_9FLAO|nr:TonB-dependent receptor [Flavobacterium sufflavum]RVT71995.1 SusC/RagA family TonB-linked outer membrane protein [Flavobacterium sufflavum]